MYASENGLVFYLGILAILMSCEARGKNDMHLRLLFFIAFDNAQRFEVELDSPNIVIFHYVLVGWLMYWGLRKQI